ncbi:MAG TPA: transglycosylase domain-containing protein [Acidocella sp.]|jgi:penicillin-binding protein 1A|nr:transglycosylase domain-containing protein [Acidocella sp.]
MARPKTPPAKAAPRKLALPKSALPRKTVRRAGFALRYATIAAIWAAALGSLVLLWFTWDLPNPASAITQPRRPAIVLLDPAGQLVARFGDIAGKVELPAQLPPYVAAAFIAIEDKRFETHGAFDAFGMLRAGISDLAHRQIVQGGSTLTQQTAKTLFLTNQRSLRRKVQEAILSLWLWRHYSRAEILGIYLNRVYLGAGAYGVDAAAKLYFGVPATKLTLAEAAILAGLPKAPSSLNPLANPQAAQNRALQVLGAMLANGAITQDQETAAEAELADAASPSSHSSWFALWTMQQAGALIPEGVDATLATTMNASLQTAAESALNTAISAEGDTLNMHQGAVVVLDAKTGAVRALVGGVGDREGYNRAVLARRQTGSAIKPVVWLAGLQAGMTPDDTVLDAPLSLAGYHPKDYERSYRGEVSMREALADSMNTAAIRILLRAGGARRVIAVARSLGLEDNLPDNASLALGTGSVGVMQLAGAYATFFNGGNRVTPYGLTAINGTRVAITPPQMVVSSGLADEMRDMLRGVVTGGTGTAAFIPDEFTAGKTGTTQNYRDAWFVGYAGGDIIAVWVGNDDNSPMNNVTGGTVPAQIFKQVATAVGGG